LRIRLLLAKFGPDDSGSGKDLALLKSSTKVCFSRADCTLQPFLALCGYGETSGNETTTMQILTGLKKVGAWFAPPPAAAADGRDQWPSRASFLLAAMGGCAG